MLTKILTSSLLFLVAIGGFFVSIDVDESAKSKNIISGISIEVSQTYAATTGTTESDAAQKWLNELVQGVNAALGIITVIVSPAIIFAGWLMSPDWTSGDLFGLREPMHNMWVIVSNIVYFIYAILLIIIALATILGKGENFNYKAMLPRLALGILMVPFTWWFVQWTISLATVVTASVINIPMDMISNDGYNRYVDSRNIPKEYFITTDASGDTISVTRIGSGPCDDTRCISAKEMLARGGGTYSTLMIYAYQIFKIQDYKKIDTTTDKIKTAGQLLNNIFISAIMLLVFGLLVMALIAMLLLRAIKLWMYAIFSPIFTLHFVAGKELFGKNTEGFDIKEFIGLCFIPAIVGLTLSFGLMIVSVIQAPNENIQPRCTNLNMTISDAGVVTGGCPLLTMFGNPENEIRRGIVQESDGRWMYNVVSIAGVKIYFRGKASVSDEQAALNATNSITGGLDAAGGIFGTIIIDVIALVFIWMAFMAAKGVSKVAETAFRPFEEMGSKVGKMAMSAPQYMPLPIPGGSIKGASKMADIALQIPEAKLNKRLESDPLYKKLKEQAGMGGDTADKSKYQQGVSNKSIDATQQAIKQMNAKTLEQSDMREILSKYPEQFKQMVNNSVLAPNIKSKLLELYGDGKDIKPETKLIIDALLTGASIDINTEVKARKYLDDQYERNKEGKGGNANGGTSGFTSTSTTDVDNKTVINVTMGSTTVQIKDNKLSDSSINEIKTLKNKWTEEEFKKEIQNLPPGVRTLIEDTIKNIPDFYKVPPKV